MARWSPTLGFAVLAFVCACGAPDRTMGAAPGIATDADIGDGTGPEEGGANDASGGTVGDGAAGGSGGGAGASGAAGGSAGTGGAAGASPCPGEGMVQIPGSDCIDGTEVTRAAYEAWLATNQTPVGQPSACYWKSGYTPSGEWPPGAKAQHPVVFVDWCDAYAYCTGVGKRLCGKVGGGENVYTDNKDANKSQWFNACTKGGTRDYPYGQTYNPQACNAVDKSIGSTIQVGSLAGCEGGHPGIFDLSGNVWEWEDSCDGQGNCQTRGGSYKYNSTYARCDFWNGGSPLNYRGDDVGFRCCGP